MDSSLQQRVGHEVDGWLHWLPRWRPGTHRGRTRLCRKCLGSPVIAAAGLAADVPHAVQHAFAMRMKALVDAAVDSYIDHNLPGLARELRRGDAHRAQRPYRPADGLEPEFSGLDLDPQPVDGAPFLFTFAELADAELADAELADAEQADADRAGPAGDRAPP
ncbi:MAG: spermidine/putrescine ABC transporter substrate-binding protein, partial [Cryobacterium sp.]